MLRPAAAAIAAIASLLSSLASADEIIVANIMPSSTTWLIGTQAIGPVPKGSHAIAYLLEGRRPVHAEDETGNYADKEMVFERSELAQYGDRGFWCIFSRAASDGRMDIIHLPKAVCQQFIANQPPAPRDR